MMSCAVAFPKRNPWPSKKKGDIKRGHAAGGWKGKGRERGVVGFRIPEGIDRPIGYLPDKV